MPRRKGSKNKDKIQQELGIEDTSSRDRKIQSEIAHAKIKKCFVDKLQEGKGAPTIKEVAEQTGYAELTVSNHLSQLKFNPHNHPLRVLTDDVLEAIAMSAKAGNSGAQKLWLQVMEGYDDKNGFKGVVEGEISADQEEGLQSELAQNVLSQLNVLEIILSRVAYRNGLPSHYILNKLRDSYYAKHTGIKGKEKSDFNQEVSFPSSFTFDFEEIKVNAREKKKEDDKMKEESTVPDSNEEQLSQADKVKQDLINKIKNKNQKEEKGGSKKTSKTSSSNSSKGGSSKKS